MNVSKLMGLALAALLAAGATSALAADGEQILTERCAGCHNLTGPAPTTAKGVRDRKGPDLFYAGNKFRDGWLVKWLVKPVRIRPAGAFYGKHIKATDKWDVVDTGTLKDHPVLKKKEAKAVAKVLMAKRSHDDLIKAVELKPASISLMMGDMMFDKFKGCIACHQSGLDYGGFSGPELYTAFDRLQPAFIYSYMSDPQAWDPKVWMPNPGLKPTDLNKMVRYLELVAEAEKKAQ